MIQAGHIAGSVSEGQEPSEQGQHLSPDRPVPLGQAPLCKGHQEPCIKKRVNKSGPNRGTHLRTQHTHDNACCVHLDNSRMYRCACLHALATQQRCGTQLEWSIGIAATAMLQ